MSTILAAAFFDKYPPPQDAWRNPPAAAVYLAVFVLATTLLWALGVGRSKMRCHVASDVALPDPQPGESTQAAMVESLWE